MSSPESGDSVAANVAQWTKAADHTDGAVERRWRREEATVERARQWLAEEVRVARRHA